MNENADANAPKFEPKRPPDRSEFRGAGIASGEPRDTESGSERTFTRRLTLTAKIPMRKPTAKPRKSPTLNPPDTLSERARDLWKTLATEYKIRDGHGRAVLTLACESFDRMHKAREAIEREGMTTRDRFGQPKPHPLLPAERDARSAMLRALVVLDIPAPHDRKAELPGPKFRFDP